MRAHRRSCSAWAPAKRSSVRSVRAGAVQAGSRAQEDAPVLPTRHGNHLGIRKGAVGMIRCGADHPDRAGQRIDDFDSPANQRQPDAAIRQGSIELTESAWMSKPGALPP